MNRKQKDAALWRALTEQQIQADLDEVLSMSPAELDHFLDSNGGDSAAIRASGAALAKELLERRQRLAWQGDMHEKLAAFREVAAAKKTLASLPRAELLARLHVARNDPRFAAPVAALFQKKGPEASTDDELQSLLDQIELLAQLEGGDPTS
jgi:hypothetical protein